jgi:predicted component of type VI protein secretion system
MPVKFSVVNQEKDEDTPTEYLFDADRVTIGRGEENHLTLPDPKRVVSTEHAMVRREDGTYRLVDRGSKNFTYVGDRRVTSRSPYELSDGDVFRIGDFRITFHALEPDEEGGAAGGETVFDHDFENPFAEPVGALAAALDDLADAYESASPQRRDEALAEAMDDVDPDPVAPAVLRRVLSGVGGQADEGEAPVFGDGEGAGAPAGDHDSSAPTAPPRPSASPDDAAGDPRAEGDNAAPPVAEGENRVDAVLDTLTDALATVLPIPWRFRHEFIGQTVMQSAETQFLYRGDGADVRRHLLDPALSPDERRERLGHVTEAAESLRVHQVAMLDGYKASVMEGAEALLDRLDPDTHQATVAEDNPLFEYVPPLAAPATLERIRTEWGTLRREDGAVAEKRVFRPAFTKAYLARMTAPRSADDADEAEAA